MITDQRNDPPEIREFTPPEPGAYLSTELQIEIPDDVTPVLCTRDFRGVQPYRIVMVGEKTSLADVLGPARRGSTRRTCTCRPARSATRCCIAWPGPATSTGGPWRCCTSPTATRPGSRCRSHRPQARRRSRRRCSPGWNSEVHRVALTPAQVREYGLPSTPLKATELPRRPVARGHGCRADRDRRARLPATGAARSSSPATPSTSSTTTP